MKKREMFDRFRKRLRIMDAEDEATDATDLLSFREWCKLNSRRYTGFRDVKELERNDRDWTSYVATVDPELAKAIRRRREKGED